MPLVRVYYAPKMADQLNPQTLTAIRTAVAETLSGQAVPDDDEYVDPQTGLEVFYHQMSPLDHSTLDILLDIEAMPFPKRIANHQQMGDQIKQRMRHILYNEQVAVWLKLPLVTWS